MKKKPPFDSGEAGREDDALWAHVTKSVVPLAGRDAGGMPRPALPPRPVVRRREAAAPPGSGRPRVTAPDPSAFAVDRGTERRFVRGRMEIEAVLDLHGLAREDALVRLRRFLLECHGGGMRCVLVITGKGLRGGAESGVLKRSLPEWVSSPPLSAIVLRHAPARGRDGGTGAFYVLLRRTR